jgi:signal-transduction protein with cAMP-binding, CBS, and nucleotidyltransferase domain
MPSLVDKFGIIFILISRLFVPKLSFPQVDFDFPYFCRSLTGATEKRSKLIAEALKNCPNLKTVSSRRGYRLSQDLVTISQNPSIKTIRIKGVPHNIDLKVLNLEENAKLKAVITFDTP